jgi:hypothetical protein
MLFTLAVELCALATNPVEVRSAIHVSHLHSTEQKCDHITAFLWIVSAQSAGNNGVETDERESLLGKFADRLSRHANLRRRNGRESTCST